MLIDTVEAISRASLAVLTHVLRTTQNACKDGVHCCFASCCMSSEVMMTQGQSDCACSAETPLRANGTGCAVLLDPTC